MIEITSTSIATRREMRDLVTATTTHIATTGLDKQSRRLALLKIALDKAPNPLPRLGIEANRLLNGRNTGRAHRPSPKMPLLPSSSPSRAEDSFCKTAMSRREDNVSRIDVTIMDRFAHSALPSPYSKIFPAFRAGAAVTPAAGLGGKRFIDFIKPHACVIALVQQHASEWTPTGEIG
jgi:hypothetical protein